MSKQSPKKLFASQQKETMWHVPIPENITGAGPHPTTQSGGLGEEIFEVRPLEPEDDRSSYSPAHSLVHGVPYGVFFQRTNEPKVILIADLSPAIDFGTPPKRDGLVRIAATLGNLTITPPVDGKLMIVRLCDRSSMGYFLQNDMLLTKELNKLTRLEPRTSGTYNLARALNSTVRRERESLVIVLSDFLIDFESAEGALEWGALTVACRYAHRNKNEVVFLRVISPMEAALPTIKGSCTVSSDVETLWMDKSSSRLVQERNARIRERLLALAGELDQDEERRKRFLEIVWQEDTTIARDTLRSFLVRRARYARKIASASRP